MDDTNQPISQEMPAQNNTQQSVSGDPVFHDNTFGQQSAQSVAPPNQAIDQTTLSQLSNPVTPEEPTQQNNTQQTPVDITSSPDVFRRDLTSPQPESSDVSHSLAPSSQPPLQQEEEEESGLPKPIKFGLIGGAILLGLLIIFGLISLLSGIFSHGSGKVTLTYWGLWEDPNVMQSIITDFEHQNPNITINYSKQDPKEYSQRLLTRIANGSGPDIFRYHNTWVPMLSSVLAPLPTSVITPGSFSKTYYPVMQNDLVQNGAIVGIPLEIDTLALFTNDQLLQKASIKPPSTWQDFINDAKALTVKDANGKIQTAGAAMGTYDNITHAPDIMSLLFAQNGADMKNLSVTTENASDALTFYTTFANSDSNVWDATLDPSILAFSKGNLAMYFGYSWDIFSIKALNPNLAFTISPAPHLPGGADMTVASYWVEGVSNKSKNQKEAMLFMQYLTRKDVLQKLYSEEVKTRMLGEPYPQVALASSLQENPLVGPFVAQSKHATAAFFAGETQDTGINAQLNAYLGNAIRSVLGNTSANSAIDTLAQGVSQVLQKYVPH